DTPLLARAYDLADRLALEARAIDRTLARHDEVGAGDEPLEPDSLEAAARVRPPEPDSLEDDARARSQPPPQCGNRSAEPARCACSGELRVRTEPLVPGQTPLGR